MTKRASSEILEVLDWLVDHLRTAGPKVVGRQSSLPPILVFTDGACEPEGTSVGGVIVDGDLCECFGAWVDDATVAAWTTRIEQTQVIGQAEIFPVLVARLTWAARLYGRRVIYFVDNESAKISLVKGYSPISPSLSIIIQCLSWDYSNNSSSWVARVPTCANIADSPSRMKISELLKLMGARIVSPIFPVGSGTGEVLKVA